MSPRKNNQHVRLKRTVILLGAINLLLILILILMPTRVTEQDRISCLSINKGSDRDLRGRSAPMRSEAEHYRDAERKQQKQLSPVAGREERPIKEIRLALVIDDVGHNLWDLKPFLEFPEALTFSVLPGLPFSGEAARLVLSADKELIMHCPMEPLNGEDPGPGVLLVSQKPEDIKKILKNNFSAVPAAVGMNNHMGSRFTADEEAMCVVMNYLKINGKFFLDSKTSPESVGFRLAEQYGVPVLERDVFVDNERCNEYMKESILKGVEIGKRRGYAVLIGHIWSTEMVGILTDLLPELRGRGVIFSSLADLIEKNGEDLP